MMRSASPTSSFISPQRSRPNTTATVSPAATRGAISRAAASGPSTGLAWSWARAVGAGGGAHRLDVGPAVARLDEAQARQAEIGHGARRRADVLAELRLDQHDD